MFACGSEDVEIAVGGAGPGPTSIRVAPKVIVSGRTIVLVGQAFSAAAETSASASRGRRYCSAIASYSRAPRWWRRSGQSPGSSRCDRRANACWARAARTRRFPDCAATRASKAAGCREAAVNDGDRITFNDHDDIGTGAGDKEHVGRQGRRGERRGRCGLSRGAQGHWQASQRAEKVPPCGVRTGRQRHLDMAGSLSPFP